MEGLLLLRSASKNWWGEGTAHGAGRLTPPVACEGSGCKICTQNAHTHTHSQTRTDTHTHAHTHTPPTPPGRDKFLEEVYKWVGVYGGRITNQLRRIGSSVDWSRCVFTMDSQMSVGEDGS